MQTEQDEGNKLVQITTWSCHFNKEFFKIKYKFIFINREKGNSNFINDGKI